MREDFFQFHWSIQAVQQLYVKDPNFLGHPSVDHGLQQLVRLDRPDGELRHRGGGPERQSINSFFNGTPSEILPLRLHLTT